MGVKSTTNAPAITVAPVAAPIPQKKEGRGLFGHFGDVFLGAGRGVGDMVTGLATMVAHPIQTAKGLGYAVTHLGELAAAFTEPYAEAIAEGRPGLALGRGFVEVGSFFIPGGVGGAAAGATSKAAKAARLASAALKGGKASEVAAVASVTAKGAKVGRMGSAASIATNVAKGTHVAKGTKVVTVAKASKASITIGKTSTAGSRASGFVAKVPKKPILSGKALMAAEKAGISEKVARQALKVSHTTYWEARAAGLPAQAAKQAATFKVAKYLGVPRKAKVVENLVNSSRMGGAAAKSSSVYGKLTMGQRLSRMGKIASEALVKRPGRTAVAGINNKVAKLGKLGERVGATTLRDVFVTAPVAVAKGTVQGVRDTLSRSWYIASGQEAAAKAAARALAKRGGQIAAVAPKAAKPATVLGKVGQGLATTGSILKNTALAPFRLGKAAVVGGVKLAYHNPRMTQFAGLASRLANEIREKGQGPEAWSDERLLQIAVQHQLFPSRENILKFIKEIQPYEASGTIGPDLGSPEEVGQLQQVLGALGYQVEASGVFDQATADAVRDFKTKLGLKQTYLKAEWNDEGLKLDAQGQPITELDVNDYATPDVIEALLAAFEKGEIVAPTKTDNPQVAEPAKPTATPETGKPTGTTEPAKPAAKAATGNSTGTTEPANSAAKAATGNPTGTAEPAKPAATASARPYTTYTVNAHDRATGLSGIARHYLGDASRWKEIYELNRAIIGENPNQIVPYQQLRMPPDAKGLPLERPPGEVTIATPQAGKPVPPGKPALDQEAERLVKEFELEATADNVAAFRAEVGRYKDEAIGPYAGSKDDILMVQRVLVYLGHHTVTPSGKWDDATADAVIAFKQDAGLHQTYRQADGNWGVNEFVDDRTGLAMEQAVEAQHKKLAPKIPAEPT